MPDLIIISSVALLNYLIIQRKFNSSEKAYKQLRDWTGANVETDSMVDSDVDGSGGDMGVWEDN